MLTSSPSPFRVRCQFLLKPSLHLGRPIFFLRTPSWISSQLRVMSAIPPSSRILISYLSGTLYLVNYRHHAFRLKSRFLSLRGSTIRESWVRILFSLSQQLSSLDHPFKLMYFSLVLFSCQLPSPFFLPISVEKGLISLADSFLIDIYLYQLRLFYYTFW